MGNGTSGAIADGIGEIGNITEDAYNKFKNEFDNIIGEFEDLNIIDDVNKAISPMVNFFKEFPKLMKKIMKVVNSLKKNGKMLLKEIQNLGEEIYKTLLTNLTKVFNITLDIFSAIFKVFFVIFKKANIGYYLGIMFYVFIFLSSLPVFKISNFLFSLFLSGYKLFFASLVTLVLTNVLLIFVISYFFKTILKLLESLGKDSIIEKAFNLMYKNIEKEFKR